MAVGTPVNLGTQLTKASATETITTVAASPAGAAIFLAVATNDAAAIFSSVVDSGGNTYSLLSSASYNALATNGVLYVFGCFNANAVASGGTITATSTLSVLCAASAFYVPDLPAANQVGGITTTTGSSATPTATASGLTAGTNYLGLAFLGVQGTTGDTFTQVSGWVAPPTRVSSTGGNVTTNAMIEGGYDAFTGVTSTTYNPTITSRPWAEILIVYTTAITYASSLSETATATDASSNNATLLASASETVTATNTAVGVNTMPVAASETATATDSSNAIPTYARAVSETAPATDSAQGLNTMPVTQTEVATVTESLSAAGSTYSVTTAETATATESETGFVSTARTLTESVTATETVLGQPTFVRSLVESVTPADIVASQANMVAAQAETATATESLSAAGSTYSVTTAETATQTAAQSANAVSFMDVSEAIAPTEAVGAKISFGMALAESVALQSYVDINGTFYVSLTETALISDTVVCRLLWELIDDSQTANWQNVTNLQNAGWTGISDVQNPGGLTSQRNRISR